MAALSQAKQAAERVCSPSAAVLLSASFKNVEKPVETVDYCAEGANGETYPWGATAPARPFL